ncbi:MAG: hypothetical protein QF551_00495 [Candidatus Marinimicrobia bacterium]|nr:hypothetical protein [Candidatus Neomarinimicrobiota bacterium]
MNHLTKILLLSFLLSGFGYSQNDTTITIVAYSTLNELDSKKPLLEIGQPNGGEEFDAGATISINWLAEDEGTGDLEISIFQTYSVGGFYDAVYTEIQNTGSEPVVLPDINTAYARSKIIAQDVYGNLSVDLSDIYYTVGDPDEWGDGFEEVYIEISHMSDPSVLDSQEPEVSVFFPTGGEDFESGEEITITWEAVDYSFGEAPISLFLSTEIGGYYENLYEDQPNTGSANTILPVVDCPHGRVKIFAADQYGNVSTALSNDYFIIGDPPEYSFGANDTTFSDIDVSENGILDSKDPYV